MKAINNRPSAHVLPGGEVSPQVLGRFARLRLLSFVLGSGGLVALLAIPAPPPQGQLLASQCFQCHGTNGKAVAGFESIAGKGANDMYQKLLEMSQRPPEGIMDVQARAYTPNQLRQIAEYLSTLPAGEEELAED